MKKLLLLPTPPTVGGNGDTLIQAASKAAKAYGAQLQRIDIRSMMIQPYKGCYGCAKTGVCVQRDDMASVLAALLVIDRLCCTFACKNSAAYLARASAIASWGCE